VKQAALEIENLDEKRLTREECPGNEAQAEVLQIREKRRD